MTPVMTVSPCLSARFLSRPNRFVVLAEIDGAAEPCHLHDSGRLGELLFPGNRLTVRKAGPGVHRKTGYDVISALSDDGEEILINSSLHREISGRILGDPALSPFGRAENLRAEVRCGESRLDWLVQRKSGRRLQDIWVEVKGVSLSVDKVAMFPDAPSERAAKHLKTLMAMKKSGARAAVLFLVLRDSLAFRPRIETDPAFAAAFYEAMDAGVEIWPIQLRFEKGTLYTLEKTIRILKQGAIPLRPARMK